MESEKYYGIADAKGIESFIPWSKHDGDKFPYSMRADLNRHRHAVYYVITINKKDASVVNAYIDKGNYTKALEILKKRAYTIGFPENRARQYQNSWDLIPNPKLDAWG